MNESTKRTLRTVLQVLLTLAVAVPVVVTTLPHSLPGYQLLAGFAGALVLIAKAHTTAEDRGWLPPFLRDVPVRVDVVDEVASAAADAAALAPRLAPVLEQAAPSLSAIADTAAAAAPEVSAAANAVLSADGPTT